MSQLWHKVRSWLRRGVRASNPRPLPILLEDLYSPAARATYRSTRTWELRLVDALQVTARDDGRLLQDIQVVAQLVRRHLLLVQRIRHVAHRLPDSRFEAVWREHRLTWSSPVVLEVEHLLELSAPYERREITEQDEIDAINEAAQSVATRIHGINDRISSVLLDVPSIVSASEEGRR